MTIDFIINQKKGKIIVSFLQNSSSFQSILNPDDNIVYTIKYNDHTFQDFIDSISYRSKNYGRLIDVDYAEAFQSRRNIGINDISDLI